MISTDSPEVEGFPRWQDGTDTSTGATVAMKVRFLWIDGSATVDAEKMYKTGTTDSDLITLTFSGAEMLSMATTGLALTAGIFS